MPVYNATTLGRSLSKVRLARSLPLVNSTIGSSCAGPRRILAPKATHVEAGNLHRPHTHANKLRM